MGKSGGRRKKGGNTTTVEISNTAPIPAANGVDLDSPLFLKRAHELKEEGNSRFQSKDYAGALEQYDKALALTSMAHPDRAVFHSNRAACLMQMKPIDYNTVISECSLALQVQPRFGRALLRRARAYEALAKYDTALQDVQALLATDPNHRDALEIARRLRVALGPRHEAQQDLQSRPSPAALGASAVRGAPIAGIGPCLPSRPVPKKPTLTAPSTATSKPDRPVSLIEDQQPSKSVSKPSKVVSEPVSITHVSNKNNNSNSNSNNENVNISLQPIVHRPASVLVVSRWRPLKLVYDHDIRLAQMPINCSFRVLREIVAKRFPSSKSVLIKYKDVEGDLVTITSTEELRIAESCLDCLTAKEKPEGPGTEKKETFTLFRLHIVEVVPEQEPPLVEEEEIPGVVEDEGVKLDDNGCHSFSGDFVSEAIDNEIVIKGTPEEEDQKEKTGDKPNNNVEFKEVEIDDWLFEFAQLFRTHVGIDPDAHIDLHELGMELCSEALEETVTSEEAQCLFEMAASKFQEVAALAFYNWGNVHMCAARKRIPVDESLSKEAITQQLQVAYDWVQERYSLAGQKYEESLQIKPDFYEGLLALGQQHFETAKLRWSFALANKVDLTTWDYKETIKLFDVAEVKMKEATDMWEKIEEQRITELKDPNASKTNELLKRRKKQGVGPNGQPSGEGPAELTADEAAEQATVMRSQIHLFWGNMLFERSQMEYKLGLNGWENNLDAAVKRFKLAGASETDISVVLKNHSSNAVEVDVDEKKASILHIDALENIDEKKVSTLCIDASEVNRNPKGVNNVSDR